MSRYSAGLVVLALLLIPSFASAQFAQGDWALTLSGAGTSQKDFRTYDATVQGDISYFLTDALQLGARQTIISADGGSELSGSTRAAVDYNFNLGRWVPFVGGSIGYRYGDAVTDAWVAGPEGGVRFFVNTTTYIQFVLGYDLDLNNGWDTGGFVYALGIGFRF